MKNRQSIRFMNKMERKSAIKKTKELHQEAIKYIQDHLEVLKSIPAPDIDSKDLEKDVGVCSYILELLKGLNHTFNKIS